MHLPGVIHFAFDIQIGAQEAVEENEKFCGRESW